MQIEVFVSTNKVGSKCTSVVTVDDEELGGMDEKQKESYLDGMAREMMFDMINWGWKLKDVPRG